jgi:hypothetical protein
MKTQSIFEVFKEALVQAAEEDLRNRGEAVTANRISVMTGVHRQDVGRIKEGDTGKRGADVLTRVIGQWRGDKKFLTDSKRPKKLTLSAKAGSFVELVESVSRDVNPYTVALELERLKLIKREGEEISLLAQEYVPRKNLQVASELLGKDIDDLLKAGEFNAVSNLKIPHLHLTTRYDNIRQAELPKIQKWFMEEGAKLHDKARKYLSKFDQDLNPKDSDSEGSGGYVSFGTFSFSSQKEESKEEK